MAGVCLATLMAGCGADERTVETIPLPAVVDQCLDELQDAGQPSTRFGTPADGVQLCAVLAGLDCVLTEPLCAGGAGCDTPQWSCADPGLELESGDVVDAHLFLVEDADSMTACDAVEISDSPQCSGPTCLAQIDYQIEYVDRDEAPLRVADTPVRIFHSGFVSERVGSFDEQAASICTAIPDFTCVGDGCDVPTRIALTIGGVGTGAVDIESTVSQFRCTENCSVALPSGRDVVFTATAADGSVFGVWGQQCGGAGRSSTCALSPGGLTEVTAQFAHRLQVGILGQGAVRSSAAGTDNDGINCVADPSGATCNEDYVTARQVTLRAEPDGASPWPFNGWLGCSDPEPTEDTCTVTMDRSREVQAIFGRVVQISVVGGGAVELTIDGEQGAEVCTASCIFTFEPGTQVSLHAMAAVGSTRYDWGSGDCAGTTDDVCDLGALDEDRRVVARFGYDVTTVFDDTLGTVARDVTTGEPGVACGSGAAGCASFLPGTAVSYTATALATPPTAFVGWQGLCASQANNPACTLNVGAPGTVMAEFGRTVSLRTVVVNQGRSAGSVAANPEPTAANCEVPCEDRYLVSTGTVRLIATAPAGTRFIEWRQQGGGDPCVGGDTGLACDVDVSDGEDRVIEAVFVSVQQVVVTLLGEGQVSSVTPSPNPAPAGWSCDGARCQGEFAFGETIELAFAVPASTHLEALRSRSSGCDGQISAASGPPTCTFTVDDLDLTIEAEVERERRFELLFGGDEMGAVQLPASFALASTLTCTDDCSRVYLSGRQLDLVAVPQGNSAFGGWQGCDTPAGTSCTAIMNADPKRVTATFLPPQTLALQLQGSGQAQIEVTNTLTGGATSCDAGVPSTCPGLTFGAGTTVTLAVVGTPNTNFVGWGGDCAGTAGPVCSLVMSEDRAVDASFAQRTHDVTVAFNGAAASLGEVRWLEPTGIAACEGPSACAETVDEPSTVRLEPVVGAGVAFQRWTGCDDIDSGDVCRLNNVVVDRAVTATFAPLETVTAQLLGSGTGRIAWTTPVRPDCVRSAPGVCSESIVVGDLVVLRAEAADADTRFLGWTGCDAVDGAECTIDEVVAGATVNATFVAIHDVAIALAGDGEGRVAWTSPALGSCDSVTCVTRRVDEGTTVILTADPVIAGATIDDVDSRFVGWTVAPGVGCDSVAAEVCTMNDISEDRAPTASFFNDRRITVRVRGAGAAGVDFSVGGSVVDGCPETPILASTGGYECSKNAFAYDGGPVTITTVTSTSTFLGWSDPGVPGSPCPSSCTAGGPCTIDVTAAAEFICQADFE